MALLATPRSNSQTPQRRRLRTPLLIENTPNNNFATPRGNCTTPGNSRKRQNLTDTPECFTAVNFETPNSNNGKYRKSKEKADEVSNLTVAVRIRPMNSRELGSVGVQDIVRVKNQDLIIHSAANNSSMSTDHIFQYDHIFWSCDETNPVYSTQEDVFLTIGKPLLNNAFRGYNACLFAYGQTGSGKSYSMMGKSLSEAVDIDSDEYSGITPRFCKDVFNRISELNSNCSATVEVSYFEIYNEKIHDLLADTSNNRAPLKVREHPIWGPYVVDLSVHLVKSYKELRNFLTIGNKNRATAATAMNEKSSRSHSIFSIELCLSDNSSEHDNSRRSKVSLIDLAGSERLGNSHNSEDKIRQGVYINKSLLILGKVISALADQKKNSFVPYRESVLTWLLKESLGGNSLTAMLATITPASTHLDETLATLRYACQARSIVNRARVNESPHDRLIRELRSEVERLRALRQDYERNSLSSSSIISIDSSNAEELDDLRSKLVETEKKLNEAQTKWEQRFMETRQSQMRELAEAEKYKAELESKVRIMKTANNSVHLSPYKTNFLEELEGVLTDQQVYENSMLENIKQWCCENGMICTLSAEWVIIVDVKNNKETKMLKKDINTSGFENISDFIQSLNWTTINSKSVKKLSKADVITSMNQIYQTLVTLQPSDSENNLCLLFAKVNKSLQSFEAALLNNVKPNKTVKFDM